MPRYTRANPAPPEKCRVVGCPNDWQGYGPYGYLCPTCQTRFA